MQIIYLDEIISTNNYATSLLQTERPAEGTIILTYSQKQGRGQGENRWESEDFKNLTFSLILYPEFLPASAQFAVSQVVSLGIAEFFSEEAEDVSVKWPNDILIGGKKASGILIENAVTGNLIIWSVAGIGINLNQKRFRLYSMPAVSLRNITGKDYELEPVLRTVNELIMRRYDQLKAGDSAEIEKNYISRLFRFEEWWQYEAKEKVFEARIIGIDSFGRLKLEERNGKISVWPFRGVRML